MIDNFIQLRGGHELASRALVTGLSTLLACARSALGLRSSRRVGRRWTRGVLGVLAQLLLEPFDPRLQTSCLALIARRQLDQELHASLAAGVIDRFGLGALHA